MRRMMMFSFNSLAEFLTCNGRHSWFYLSRNLLNSLDAVDLDNSYVEATGDSSLVRIWYPRDKYFNRPIAKEELQKMLEEAISNEEWVRVKQLKERINKCN